MSPKDKRHTLGMTVEKVSLGVLAVLGAVGLGYFTATALGVLPIISAS
jgi:preprotein translocase subunit SecY